MDKGKSNGIDSDVDVVDTVAGTSNIDGITEVGGERRLGSTGAGVMAVMI